VDIENIKVQIRSFKQALIDAELYLLGHEYRKFKRFPEACCVLTSQLLARFLVRNYPELELRVVHGETPEGMWHYWVEHKGEVFDITMAQHGIEAEDVIWSESLWHQKCHVLETWLVEHDFNDVCEGADSASAQALENGYKLIMSKLNL
jgi:hypothetical protein